MAELVDGAGLAEDLAVAGVFQKRQKGPSAVAAAGEDKLGQLDQGNAPDAIASDGTRIWVANASGNSVTELIVG